MPALHTETCHKLILHVLLQPLTGVPAEEAAEGTLSPEATAGLFSTLTFKWISPLMSKARLKGTCCSCASACCGVHLVILMLLCIRHITGVHASAATQTGTDRRSHVPQAAPR